MAGNKLVYIYIYIAGCMLIDKFLLRISRHSHDELNTRPLATREDAFSLKNSFC